ncbi:TetR family transcriptional regulator [Nocardia otitidiscaviarum]|uniref:TetR family transcriptional regulator n=1 Tax=Nocardia otitidiscaviarum TaxID=1823 RepID=A0A516NJN5_9NOCA|nr:TetR/AcrR family transcriptional regulator [Nocardia otitidiscaviarum]MCP9623577.1 TetR/AcrR family transcriptional regulator [Nocardia otitidiscaviarum]QDP79117.1 TetR family transcriptional regulator [Nocardia otitidiscaviarum]
MPESVGLREQEKARVRRELMDAALRLFERQGYEQTTVQQIADAVRVSRRTFHRHFPSKAAVVFGHEEDLVAFLLAAMDRRPPEESALTALRGALRELLVHEPDAEQRREQAATVRRARQVLITNPELRQENFTGAVLRRHVLAEHFARRAGLAEADLRTQVAAAACFAALGVGLDHWVVNTDRSLSALHETLDGAIATLQDGLDV